MSVVFESGLKSAAIDSIVCMILPPRQKFFEFLSPLRRMGMPSTLLLLV